jgi:hypothetical protein
MYSSSYFSNSRYGSNLIVCVHKIGKDPPEVGKAKATASRERKADASTNIMGQKREAKGPTIKQRMITTFDGNFRIFTISLPLESFIKPEFRETMLEKIRIISTFFE